MSFNKNLIDSFVNITSKAAISCFKYLGKNDKNLADKAATDEMRKNLNLLDIDGERIRSWRNNFGDDVIVPTLHEMLNQLGAAGWELVSHVGNQDVSSNGVTFHYYNFKRPLN